mmetsp:Transcript_67722/g.218801  ORF Transcript_67722/g.218801 Transcript_67722/m.218801 type:complete len:526 (+) Transcript_67722:29-1606(+)
MPAHRAAWAGPAKAAASLQGHRCEAPPPAPSAALSLASGHAHLRAHGIEHALALAATARELDVRLPQVHGHVDPPVLRVHSVLGELLGWILPYTSLRHEADRKGRGLHRLLAPGIGAIFLSAGRLAGAPRRRPACWRRGTSGLESDEVGDAELLIALGPGQQAVDVGELRVVLLLLLVLLACGLLGLGLLIAAHGETHEVCTVQPSVFILPQDVEEVLGGVLALAQTDVREEVPRFLGHVPGLSEVPSAEVRAGDDEQSGRLAGRVRELLAEGLGRPGRGLGVGEGLGHELRVGQDVERVHLRGLVAGGAVDAHRLARNLQRLPRVALLGEAEVRGGKDQPCLGDAQHVGKLAVDGHGLLCCLLGAPLLVLLGVEAGKLQPGRGLPLSIARCLEEGRHALHRREGSIDLLYPHLEGDNLHQRGALALAVARGLEAVHEGNGRVKRLLQGFGLHMDSHEDLHAAYHPIQALRAKIAEDCIGRFRLPLRVPTLLLLELGLGIQQQRLGLSLFVGDALEERDSLCRRA